MKTLNRSLMATLFALPLFLNLVGCASEGVTRAMNGPRKVRTDIFPGNHWNYSFGTSQKVENFSNVEHAQSNVKPRNASKVWVNVVPANATVGTMGNLQHYFMFDVRWKLKDGREYILENIDMRTISNDYLRKSPIQMQWQRENRSRHTVGDGGAILTFEIKDDAVLLKWIVRSNRTPIDQRLTATGEATRWDFHDEEHLMATLVGIPTSGIDFSIQDEPRKLPKEEK